MTIEPTRLAVCITNICLFMKIVHIPSIRYMKKNLKLAGDHSPPSNSIGRSLVAVRSSSTLAY